MSRTSVPITADELRAALEELLANPPGDGPADGPGIPSDTGLDQQTMAAVERAWSGGESPALLESARQELAMQLDGTHAREGEAQSWAIFDAGSGRGRRERRRGARTAPAISPLT